MLGDTLSFRARRRGRHICGVKKDRFLMDAQPILNLLHLSLYMWCRWLSEDADCLESGHGFLRTRVGGALMVISWFDDSKSQKASRD